MNLILIRIILLAGTFCLICLPGSSQQYIDSTQKSRSQRTLNSCGVVASFTPDRDSVVSGKFSVKLTSTSTNATSVKWLVDNWWMSTDNTYNFTYDLPGIYELKLVAYNGDCTDTATCVYIYPGTQPVNRDNLKAYYGTLANNDYSETLTALKEGGYVMGGYTNINYNGISNNGFLIKVNEAGCVEWTKTIPHQGDGKVLKIIQCPDGNLALSGYTNFGYYLIKLDKQGNLLWSKTYKQDNQAFEISTFTSTSDNGFILAGNSGRFTDANVGVIRTNSTGDILWNRGFYKHSSVGTLQNEFDVLQQGNEIFLTTHIWQTEAPGPDTMHGVLIKLNDLDGATVWSKKILINGKPVLIRDIHPYGNDLLLNIDGNGNVFSAPNTSFTILDHNANILKSSTLILGDINYTVSITTALPMDNGDIYFLDGGTETLQNQPLYAYHSFFIKLDKYNNIKWSKSYGSRGKGRYFYAALGPNGTFAALGDEAGSSYAQYGYLSDQFMLSKIDSTGGSIGASCEVYNTKISVIPNTAQSAPYNWTREIVPTAQAVDTIYNVKTIYTSAFYICPQQFVDSCSYIKVTGPQAICNLSDTYVYKTHRNTTCNQPVQWDIPKNALVVSKTDTALTLRFSTLGTYYVGAALPFTCSPVKDSLAITVGTHAVTLNLGSDTSICLGKTLVLHAGNSFTKYTWQDGSTDSLFKVTTSGSYWVKVSDSCSNTFSDTINISIAAKLPVSIGADRTKCNNDTIQLTAPPGFLNYSWSNNYKINSLTSRTVVVYPDVDTMYYLKAEKTPGCFGFDTVAIKVNQSPKINLGADTSICQGDNISIDAGPGFATYLWSTGASTSMITTGSQGVYTVIATTPNGCKSNDTLQLVTIFNNPIVRLNKDSTLCAGGSRLLDPGGNYTSYLWNNGSTGKTLLISSIGNYTVKVKDANGCLGGDSIKITRLLDPPRNFLPADTSICSYGSLLIVPLNNYFSYLWNTNEVTKSITIQQAGTYRLLVVDNNNCSGADTIHVSQKQCLEGIYVPSAFTPNGDGKNDIFKPQIFGNLIAYRFTVYNRFGGKMFETTVLQKGWDGTNNGKQLPTGGYVWTCKFQLSGQAERLEKGVVIIVR